MIDDDVQSFIDELGIHLFINDFELPGYYIPPWNAIFVDEKLSHTEQRVVLLHEIGHAAKQRGDCDLYRATMNMKLKMEYGVNKFMIEFLFNEYIKYTDMEPRSVNYIEFMRQNDIPSRDENIVKEVILNY